MKVQALKHAARRFLVSGVALTSLTGLVACGVGPIGSPPSPEQQVATLAPKLGSSQSAKDFVTVVQRLEPVAERECMRRTTGVNCHFKIVVDDRRGQPANAFQSLDDTGRPVITFTVALIDEARNADELAFVMGHEAAHHIAGHLDRQRKNAEKGAEIFAGLATLTGGSEADVVSAAELGEFVGARTYSKEFELEADQLGTVITYRAGFNPLAGAQFFARIPDPGNRFLGTHPPNSARYYTVRSTVDALVN